LAADEQDVQDVVWGSFTRAGKDAKEILIILSIRGYSLFIVPRQGRIPSTLANSS
jgi:hypothetical protein